MQALLPPCTNPCKCALSGATAVPRSRPNARLRPRTCARAALPEWVQQVFDFDSWAPRSSRIWRLQQFNPSKASEEADADQASDDMLSGLSNQISQLQDGGSSTSSTSDSALLDTPAVGEGAQPPASASFSDADDDELAAALGRRVSKIATVASSATGAPELDEMAGRQPLTGQEIKSLLLQKYGRAYDLSFVKRAVPGMRTFVCLNVMWLYLGQRSLRLNEEQYMEKLDGVAALVAALGQTDKVRAFLRSPARSSKGLPARPVVGTAISIRLDLEQAVIDEWFGRGYD